MMKTMLDPSGRIGPVAFRDAAITLIFIGAIFGLLPWINSSLSWVGYFSILLIYPTIVIWVKRFHDAGKSGWMYLGVFVAQVAIAWAVSHFLIVPYFAPDLVPPVPGSPPAAAFAYARELQEAISLPSTIFSVVLSLAFVLAANALLKSDPGPNAYDPPPHMR